MDWYAASDQRNQRMTYQNTDCRSWITSIVHLLVRGGAIGVIPLLWPVAWPAFLRAESLVLENPALRIEISVEKGRLMSFRPTGLGRELLWHNSPEEIAKGIEAIGYANWGGDKVWPVAQIFWRYGVGRVWPPDSAVDGSAATLVRRTAESVTIRFPVSEAFGSQLERTFALDRERPLLRIRNSLTQVDSSPFPAQIWSITQTELPQRVLLHREPSMASLAPSPVNLNNLRSSPPLGPIAFPEGSVESGETWVSVVPLAERLKLGSLGGWIAGFWPEGTLVQAIAADPEGMYPESSSLQLYHSSAYAELETLGPSVHLARGETLETEVVWVWSGPLNLSLADSVLAGEIAELATSLAPTKTVVTPVAGEAE